MKEKLIAKLKAAGVENPEKVAEALMKDSENGKLLVDDGKDNVFIPKSRLDAEIDKKKKIQASLDNANDTIKELETAVEGNKEAAQKVNDYKKAAEKAEAELETFTKNQVIKEAIASFEKVPHDASAVLALLDKESIMVKDGKVLGLDEQLKKMVEDKAFLFKDKEGEDPDNPDGKGTGKPGNPKAGSGLAGGKDEDKTKSIGSALGKEMANIVTAPKDSFFQ